MTEEIKLGILGANGSMGRQIMGVAVSDPDTVVKYALDVKDCPNLGEDIGPLIGSTHVGVKIESVENLAEILDNDPPDVFIDFTVAEATEKNAPMILSSGIPIVIGTTGLSGEFRKKIDKIISEKKVSAVMATNMSVGVNLLFKIAAKIAAVLKDWEVEIIEVHHHRKKDAPSGTALTLLEKICEARGLDENTVAKFGRNKGKNPRKWGNGEIGVHAVRAGDIVGEHTIIYAGEGERIELIHRAHSRKCFASGAVRAAKFVYKHADEGRLYDMSDVIGLKEI